MEKRKWWQKVLRPAAALGRLFIPNLGTLLLVGLLFWAQQAGALGGHPQGIAPNALPGVITYQGKLTDAAGNPITGNLRMTFALYSVPTGGTALWSETYDGANAVPVQGGEFVVNLGSINPIPAAVMEQSPLYLGVAVAGDGEMAPRAVVSAVHVAFAAQESIDNFRVPGNLVNEGRFYLGGSRTTVAGTLEHETVHTSDRAFLIGTYTGEETSDLRLYILDNSSDRFSIWGDSCGGGACGDLTAASEAHRFSANGSAWHKGTVTAGGPGRFSAATFLSPDIVLSADSSFGRGDGGRALVHGGGDTLIINYNNDFAGGVIINGLHTGRIVGESLQSDEEREEAIISRFSQGDLLCWDATADRLEKCALLASPLVVAVADENGKPIVLGAETVKVVGPVRPGDLLVASDTPGYAVAWSQVGTGSPPVGVVIAKALEGFAGERGMVKAMILGR